MKNTLFNLNNSRSSAILRTLRSYSPRAIPLIVGGLAVVILIASLQLPPALAGRLHPAVAPAAIALATMTIAIVLMFRAGPAQGCDEHGFESVPAAPGRAIVAAVAAILLLSVGVHALGVVVAVALAGAIAAGGVAGVGLARAALIGAGVSVTCAIVFVWALRQPLPL